MCVVCTYSDKDISRRVNDKEGMNKMYLVDGVDHSDVMAGVMSSSSVAGLVLGVAVSLIAASFFISYSMAANFRGARFSRIAVFKNFAETIFADQGFR